MEEDRCRQKWTTISYDAQPPKLPASKGWSGSLAMLWFCVGGKCNGGDMISLPNVAGMGTLLNMVYGVCPELNPLNLCLCAVLS